VRIGRFGDGTTSSNNNIKDNLLPLYITNPQPHSKAFGYNVDIIQTLRSEDTLHLSNLGLLVEFTKNQVAGQEKNNKYF